MSATPGDDIYSWTISSQSGNPPHTVDLLSNNGIGMCDCEQFRFRLSPKIAKGLKVNCKHIVTARLQLAEDIIARQVQLNAELETQNDREPTEYEALANEFKRLNPICGVCHQKPTEDIHHNRGRLGPLLCDTRFWIPTCRTCHAWIDSNRNAARKMIWNGIPVLCEKGQWNSPPRDDAAG